MKLNVITIIYLPTRVSPCEWQ